MFAIFWATAYLAPPATELGALYQYFGAALVAFALAMVPYGRAAFGLLAFRPAGWRLVSAGMLGGLIVSVAVSPIAQESEWLQQVVEMVRESGQLLASLLLIAGLAPLAEELVFRGLLYGWLEGRWGPRVAVVGSALAFAAAHSEPVYIAMALPSGLFLGLLRWRSNSLVTPLIAHVTNNGAFVLMAKYLDF
ncbi:MAG TPA: CPBP family intramembrane glutamic endopeptidase [Reyranella sp.]|nr:CPBP family intramembrane glutamic endopeptidase [Reyranella sp.]